MALRFDQLESAAEQRRRSQLREQDYRDIRELFPAPPGPSTDVPQRTGENTLLDTIRRMHEQRMQNQGIPPPSQPYPPAFEQGSLPAAGQRYAQAGGPTTDASESVARPATSLPPGFRFIDEAPKATLPPGFRFIDQAARPVSESGPPASAVPGQPPDAGVGEKIGRFLENVQPHGPISGLIALGRTAGEAAQGRRPDLLTEQGIESAIPEAVSAAVPGPGLGGANIGWTVARYRGIEPLARDIPKFPQPQPRVPSAPPLAGPKLLTSRLSPEEAASAARNIRNQQDYAAGLARESAGGLPTARDIELGIQRPIQVQPEAGQAPSTTPAPTPPPSQLLPSQTVKEFSAVRKGVELRDRLNPGSPENLSGQQRALEGALRPHISSILATGQRSQIPVAALEAAVPENLLSEALSSPPKAASIANWMRVYERALRSKMTPQAKASLDLATRNLNNNLGTDLGLGDILK